MPKKKIANGKGIKSVAKKVYNGIKSGVEYVKKGVNYVRETRPIHNLLEHAPILRTIPQYKIGAVLTALEAAGAGKKKKRRLDHHN
jgi:hypothetical protein